MGAAVKWNDARVVNHLDEYGDVSSRLHDSNIVVICRRHHGRSCRGPRDAAFLQGPVFGAIEFMSSICGLPFRLPPFRSRSQRRNLSIWGIDHQRRTPRLDDSRSAVPPEIVISPGDIGFRCPIAAIHIVPLPNFFLVVGGFLRRKEFLPCKVRRPLHRRDRREAPGSLQVRLTIRRTGRLRLARYKARHQTYNRD